MVPKNTNIYLDIDGTIIHEEANRLNQPAAHLHEFLKILKDYPVYWLTMRCRDGDPSPAQHYLQGILPKEVYQYALAFKPTTWDAKKTEAIDFDSPFIWFDNSVMPGDLDELARHNATDNLVKVDLKDNPDQLRIIIENLFTDPT